MDYVLYLSLSPPPPRWELPRCWVTPECPLHKCNAFQLYVFLFILRLFTFGVNARVQPA
jgi:hypothetical protein